MQCPKCGKEMEVMTLEGVQIDKCADHGLWFDKGELERVNALRGRRHQRLQSMQVRHAKTDGKIQGAFLGWLSLLFD